MTHEEAGYYMVGGKIVVFEFSLKRSIAELRIPPTGPPSELITLP